MGLIFRKYHFLDDHLFRDLLGLFAASQLFCSLQRLSSPRSLQHIPRCSDCFVNLTMLPILRSWSLLPWETTRLALFFLAVGLFFNCKYGSLSPKYVGGDNKTAKEQQITIYYFERLSLYLKGLCVRLLYFTLGPERTYFFFPFNFIG